jgi:hypothetical protein
MIFRKRYPSIAQAFGFNLTEQINGFSPEISKTSLPYFPEPQTWYRHSSNETIGGIYTSKKKRNLRSCRKSTNPCYRIKEQEISFRYSTFQNKQNPVSPKTESIERQVSQNVQNNWIE